MRGASRCWVTGWYLLLLFAAVQDYCPSSLIKDDKTCLSTMRVFAVSAGPPPSPPTSRRPFMSDIFDSLKKSLFNAEKKPAGQRFTWSGRDWAETGTALFTRHQQQQLNAQQLARLELFTELIRFNRWVMSAYLVARSVDKLITGAGSLGLWTALRQLPRRLRTTLPAWHLPSASSCSVGI